MKTRILALAIGIGSFVSSPVLAHHSFAAQYDSNKPVAIRGVVTKVEWTNPHIFFYVQAKDESGASTSWACEGGSPNSLFREGWRHDSLKVGDEVSAEGFLAKDGSKTLNARSVKFSDGRKVFAGSSYGKN